MATIPGIYVEIKGDSTQLQKDITATKQLVTESARGMSDALNNVLSGRDISTGTNKLIANLGELSRATKVTSQDFKNIGVDLGTLQSITGVTAAQFQTLQSKMLETQGAKAQEKAFRDIATSAGLTEKEIRALGAQMGVSQGTIDKTAAGMMGLGKSTEFSMSKFQDMIVTVGIYTVAFGALNAAVGGVKGEFERGLKSIEDFNVQIASSAAFLTTFSKQAQTGDLAGSFDQASKYAAALATSLEMVDAKTIASGKDLQTMSETFIQNGVVLDINNKKQVEGFTNIATALALVTAGQNKDIQMRQEINALLQGQIRATDRLPKLLQNIDPQLKEHIVLWKTQRKLIENVGKLLKGFSVSTGNLDQLWVNVGSTMETIHNRVLRGGFEPVFKDLIGLAQELNAALMDSEGHLTPIAKTLQADVVGAYESGKQILKDYGGELVVLAGALATAKIAQLALNVVVKANPYMLAVTALITLNETLGLFKISASDAATVAGNFSRSLQGMSAVAKGEISFWQYATSSAAQLKDLLAKNSGLGEINTELKKLAETRKEVAQSFAFTSEARRAKEDELTAIDRQTKALLSQKEALQQVRQYGFGMQGGGGGRVPLAPELTSNTVETEKQAAARLAAERDRLESIRSMTQLRIDAMPEGLDKALAQFDQKYIADIDRIATSQHIGQAAAEKYYESLAGTKAQGEAAITTQWMTKYRDKVEDISNSLDSLTDKDKTLSTVDKELGKIGDGFTKWRNSAQGVVTELSGSTNPEVVTLSKNVQDLINKSTELEPKMKAAFQTKVIQDFDRELGLLNANYASDSLSAYDQELKKVNDDYDKQVVKAKELWGASQQYSVELDKIEASRKKAIADDATLAKTGSNMWRGFIQGAKDAEKELGSLGKLGYDIFGQLQSAMSGSIVAAMKGQFDQIGSLWDDMLTKMEDSILTFLANKMTSSLLSTLFTGADSLFGSTLGSLFGDMSGIAGNTYTAGALNVYVTNGGGLLGGAAGALGSLTGSSSTSGGILDSVKSWVSSVLGPEMTSILGKVVGTVGVAAGAYGIYSGYQNIKKGNTGAGAVQMGLGAVSAYKGAVELGVLESGTATKVASAAAEKLGITMGKTAATELAKQEAVSRAESYAAQRALTGTATVGAGTAIGTSTSMYGATTISASENAAAALQAAHAANTAAAAAQTSATASAAASSGSGASSGAAAAGTGASIGGGIATAGAAYIAVQLAMGLWKSFTNDHPTRADKGIDDANIKPGNLAAAGFNKEFKDIQGTILQTVNGFQQVTKAAYDAKEGTLALNHGQLLAFDKTTKQWSQMVVNTEAKSAEDMMKIHRGASEKTVADVSKILTAVTGLDAPLSASVKVATAFAGALEIQKNSSNGAKSSLVGVTSVLMSLGLTAEQAAKANELLAAAFSQTTSASDALTNSTSQTASTTSKAANALASLNDPLIGVGSAASKTSPDIQKLIYSLANMGESAQGAANQIGGAIVKLKGGGGAWVSAPTTKHADGGIFTQPAQIGSHWFGEKGMEALMPLPEGRDTLKNIISRIDKLGTQAPVVHVYIGNKEFDSYVAVIADKNASERQQSGVVGRVRI